MGAYACFYNVNTYEPSNVYYAFNAFGQLYALGNQTEAISDTAGLHVLSAACKNEKAVLMTNTTGCEQTVKTNLKGNFKAYLIDIDHLMTEEEINPAEFTLKENQVILIKTSI